MRLMISLASALLVCCAINPVAAEDLVNVETVLEGLNNPSGVAIQPGTGHLFISDSGAAKIIRWDPKTKKAEDVITDFPQDVYGKGPMYNIGPLGLAFKDKETLIVGGGGNQDVDELVRIYSVPEPGKTIKADAMKQKLGPLGKTDEVQAEGNYYGVTLAAGDDKTAPTLYVTCHGDDTKGWVARSVFKDGKFGPLERYIATKEATQVDSPVAIAISPEGRVVVGQSGEISVPKDALLTFYKAADGKLLMNLKTELFDLVSLAYSPRGNHLLYAVDFAWMESAQGGLFRLDDDGKNGVTVIRMATLDKPTAAAVAAEGKAIYVTIFGTAKEGEDAKPGKLLKLTPKDDGDF